MSLREEIIAKIDLLAEFQKHGGRVPPSAHPNSDGWIAVHAIDRTDNNPSAALNVGNNPNKRGIYVDHAATGKGATSFFNMVANMPGTPFIDGGDVFRYYGKQTGVLTGDNGNRHDKPGPTMPAVESFQKNLTPEIRQFMREKRGLTETSLQKYRIGWCLKRERNSFPVFDENNLLVNIRFHNSKKKPKTLSWDGYGQARLYGLERLMKAPPGSTVVITEGEFDCMLVEQETGYIGVSATNGTKGFKPEWVKHFHGHHVVLAYDADQEGREAVASKVLPAFRPDVADGRVLSIKTVWLYDKIDKAHKDFTDWLVVDGGSGGRFREIVAQTPAHTFPTPTSHLEPPIPLKSFELIDHSEFAGRRVSVPLQVFGENTVTYHAPTKITITHCQARKESKCNGPDAAPGSCVMPIEVPLGSRIMISAVRSTEAQFKKLLQDHVCDKGRRPEIRVAEQDRVTIRELWAHQVVGQGSERTELELVEKPVCVIGGDLVGIGKYQVVGRVITSYRDQQPTMIIDKMERLEEDYQCFDLERSRPTLERLRAMEPQDIVEDLSLHVTRIYERDDLHLGVLLVLCSVLWFDFPGDGRIRGWLAGIIVGDTGTGKTTVSQSLFDFANVGDRVSGLTTSRTGLTYGCEHDERKGWRVKAGAFLKMSRQALIVDEAQDIKSDELKTMAEGIDTGVTRIDKIANKLFESQTRVLFNCNPRDQRKFWEQRTMDSFRFGCEAIKGIFAKMMIRRIDLVMYCANFDIEDKKKIFFPEKTDKVQQISTEDLQTLIFYAWNLKPEQIVIDEDTAKYIRRISQWMAERYGGTDELPIVYAEDFRKTMARLSVAYAVLDLATTEDFGQVIVNVGHVAEACEFLDRIYSAENCDLQRYAFTYRAAHGLEGLEEIKRDIDALLSLPETDERRRRFIYIARQLIQCGEGDQVRKGDLADEFGVEKKMVQRHMKFFQKHHLLSPKVQNGYMPVPKFFQVLRRLERLDPVKYSELNPLGKVFAEDE
jgi:hypothetical protein